MIIIYTLTTYFTASCLFTLVHQGTMYTEFNSITLFTLTYCSVLVISHISLSSRPFFTPQPLERAVWVLFSPMVSRLAGGRAGGGKSLSGLYLRNCNSVQEVDTW